MLKAASEDPLLKIDKKFKYECSTELLCGSYPVCHNKDCTVHGTDVERKPGDRGDGGIGGEGGYPGQITVIGAAPTIHNNKG